VALTAGDDGTTSAQAVFKGPALVKSDCEHAESLIDLVLDSLRKLPVGQSPKIEQTKRIRVQAFRFIFRLDRAPPRPKHARRSFFIAQHRRRLCWSESTTNHGPTGAALKGTPEILVSSARGVDSSDDARKRTEVVDRLCEALGQHGWNILRDSNVLRSGELISGFMKRIGLADHVIVV
jgi:hypothetical protein